MLVLLLAAALLPAGVSGSCVVVQDDIDDCPLSWITDPAGERCVPRPAGYNGDGINRTAELVAHPFVPFVDKYGKAIPNMCPQYPDVCCSDFQMNSLAVNFEGIWAAFGDIGSGGCPACYQNAVNFWCGYTCSPNQSDYVAYLGTATKVDPVGTGLLPVAMMNTVLDTSYACSLFNTCAQTGKVKEFSPLQSCEGFLKYQGETEAIQTGLTFINFNFTGSISGGSSNATNATAVPSLSFPLYSCCNFPGSINPNSPLPWPPSSRDGANMSCPCASCAGMCGGGVCAGGAGAYAGLGDSPDDPLLGFNSPFIVIFASCVLAVSVPLVLWRALGEEAAGSGLQTGFSST